MLLLLLPPPPPLLLLLRPPLLLLLLTVSTAASSCSAENVSGETSKHNAPAAAVNHAAGAFCMSMHFIEKKWICM
jgi:hypothetical protein